jgi:hypothetical protein
MVWYSNVKSNFVDDITIYEKIYRPPSKNAQDDFPPLDDESNYLILYSYQVFYIYILTIEFIFLFLSF